MSCSGGSWNTSKARKLELYPAQEAAILELFEDRNVILNTPTGSGKSLVASALHFKSLAEGKRSVYTCPIKALVNEKWMALCREFGPDNVGLSTGDATVNRDAPILCCTAEILANIALARRRRRERARRGDGRVSLLLRSRSRRGLAGAVAHAAAHAFSADVRDARRHDVFRGGTDEAERPRDGDGAVQGSPGAAGASLLGPAAGDDAGNVWSRKTRRRFTSFTSRNWTRRKARRISRASMSARGRRRAPSPAPSKVSSSAVPTGRKSNDGCGTASGCITPGCCRNIACSSSNSRNRVCSK